MNFLYFDQLDSNKISQSGTFNKFISMENQNNGEYTVIIVASENGKSIKKQFKFNYENLSVIKNINMAKSCEELSDIIDENCEKIHLDLIEYDELTDELRLKVLENLLQHMKKDQFKNCNEFKSIFKEVISNVLKNKEVPKVKENLVQGKDFVITDNYDGTSDKIEFKEGVFNEENLKIKLYALKDISGGIEDSNLNSPIILNNSIKNLDGTISVPMSEIGDLKAGKYKFIVTAEDLNGVESFKDKSHVITIELVKTSLEEEAKRAVEKAENTIWKVDYENAKTLVDSLKDSNIKKELTSRLEVVKEKIYIEEKQEEIKKEAYMIVSKAESFKTMENYNAAMEIVNKIKEVEVKNRLLKRLERVKKYIDAINSNEEIGFSVIGVYGSNGIAKVKVQLVFKDSGIAITDNLDAYKFNITSHEVVNIKNDGQYFMVDLKQDDLFKRDKKIAQEAVKMEITKEDTSKRILPKDNLDKNYELVAAYKWIKPNELATSLDGSSLKLSSPSCDKEGIVKAEISMSGSLQLRPQSLGETTVSVKVSDSKGNEITVSFKVVISKPAPKLLKEKLQQDVDFSVIYGKDGEPEKISFKSGIFAEEGYEVRLYQWHDKNNNNILNRDSGELGKYIVLNQKTIKDKEGNIILPNSDISGLDIKKYKYIVAVVDLSTGKESRVSQDFGFTIKAKPTIPTEPTKPEEGNEEVPVKNNEAKITEVDFNGKAFLTSVKGIDKDDMVTSKFDFSKFTVVSGDNKYTLKGAYRKAEKYYKYGSGEYGLNSQTFNIGLTEEDLQGVLSIIEKNKDIKLVFEEGWNVNSTGGKAVGDSKKINIY